jgi:hypothetical protein
MADPGYIVDNVLTDGEAWVAIATAAPSSADVSFVSTDDGQVGDFSQYMDLVIVGYWQSGSNYAWQYLRGNGAATDAYGNASGTASQVGQVRQAGGGANIFSAAVINIFDINSGKYKSVLSYAAADWDGSGGADMDATTWKSQAPITEIDLTTSSGFSAGTRIDLFGVLPRMVA